MPSGKPTDYISLTYAIHCMMSEIDFETDAAKPAIQYQFPDQDPAFEKLLLALMQQEVTAFGVLSVADIDLPALEGHIISGDVSRSCLNWRRKGEIFLASGSEAAAAKMPPDAWWNDGVIWEQSVLWANDPDQFDERIRLLNIERHVPCLPERPFSFERAICFTGIKFELEDLASWSASKTSRKGPTKKPSASKRGMKPTEDYQVIESELWKLVQQGRKWETWQQVWGDVRHLFKNPEEIEEKYLSQPDKKLTEHLRSNAPELYDALRERIETVKRRRK